MSKKRDADPWLPARLRASTLVVQAEQQVERAVRSALEEWLQKVRGLILGDALTAAGQQPPDLGGFAASEPDWVAAILKFVMPVLSELFGERFLSFARVATISDQPYREAYIAEVSSRLKLFPSEQFEEIRPEIQEAISEGESIDQIRDRVAAILDFDAAADAPGTADHDRTKRLRARINQVEKLLDDPAVSVDDAVELRAERRELYDDLHAAERRWQWKARRIARTECLPGETTVDGARITAAYRRWYSGQLVDVETRDGRKITGTPNHPVLTPVGWRGLGELSEGDHLVCNRARVEEVGSAGDPNKQGGPATIGEIFDAAKAVVGSQWMSATSVDFHGDGMDGDVDVVRPNGILLAGRFTAIDEGSMQGILPEPLDRLVEHAALRAPFPRGLPVDEQPGRLHVSGGDPGLVQTQLDCFVSAAVPAAEIFDGNSLLVRCDDLGCWQFETLPSLRPPGDECDGAGLRQRAHDTSLTQHVVDRAPVEPRPLGHLGGAEAAEVKADEALPVFQGYSGLFADDAGGAQGGVDGGAAEAGSFRDLSDGEAADIELDEVVSVVRRDARCHVYNLSTVDGYFSVQSGVYTGNTLSALNGGSFSGAVARSEILDQTLYKQWLATKDVRTREDHREADGQIVRMASPFNVCDFPMMFPGMPGGPAACVINCRCTFLALEEDELTHKQLAAINEADPQQPATLDDLDEQGGIQSTDTARQIAQAETVTAGGDTMPEQTEQMPNGWRGVLAALDTPTGDGRVLATPPGGVRTREGTLFIAWQREGGHGHDGAVLAGRIDRAWTGTLEDGKHVLMGEGPFDLGGDDGAEAARLVHEGFLSGISVDPDDVTMEWRFVDKDSRPVDVDGMDEDDFWDAYEAGDIVELMVMTDWRLSGATLTPFPAFDEARIEPLYGYVPAAEVAAALGVTGDTGLAVAERDHPWDGQEAEGRVFDAYTSSDGDVDTGAVSRAFLWRDTDADPATQGVYRLGFCDIVDGELRIIPAGVVATAGGHGVDAADIPDDAKEAIRSKICTLYSAVRAVYTDFPDCPFDDGVQAAGAPQPRVYAAADFADPALPEYTPLQVTTDGRVYGHLASWRQPDGSQTCHTSYPDACVTPPRSAARYAYFHLGEVTTDAGPLPVGKITLGTGHADPKTGYRGAVEHYDDTGTVVAVVRAGEDEFGIWVAGRILDTVNPEQVETLMRSPLSGDWRRIGGNLELVAALCVNVPGFPIPRAIAASGESGLQVSLVAAGAPAAFRNRRTGRRKADAEPVDYQRLAAAVVREMRDIDARRQRSDQLARQLGRDSHSRVLAAEARINQKED